MAAQTSTALVTLLAIPKPFHGHIGMIQQNAIASWKALGNAVDVVLAGDEYGVREVAREFDLQHLPKLRATLRGTPLVSDALLKLPELGSTPLLGYINADIILVEDFVTTIDRLQQSVPAQWLVIGRRIDCDVREDLTFSDKAVTRAWTSQMRRRGKYAPIVCKDFMIYTRDLYRTIPEFAVGRGNWDNWMVHHARQAGATVIDATQALTAIHQCHDYRHVGGGRGDAYVHGEEAMANQRAAGGRHLVSGSTADWVLQPDLALKRRRLPALAFWADLPNFLKLVTQLDLHRHVSNPRPAEANAVEVK